MTAWISQVQFLFIEDKIFCGSSALNATSNGSRSPDIADQIESTPVPNCYPWKVVVVGKETRSHLFLGTLLIIKLKNAVSLSTLDVLYVGLVAGWFPGLPLTVF